MDPKFTAKIINNIFYKKITSCENEKKSIKLFLKTYE
jgi:hypothetical protein